MFYDLPHDVKQLIYQFDPTYHITYKSVVFEFKMFILKKNILFFPEFIYAPPYIYILH